MGRSFQFAIVLILVKDYVVNIWEMCNLKLSDDDSSQCQSSTEDLRCITGFEGRSGMVMCQGSKPVLNFLL